MRVIKNSSIQEQSEWLEGTIENYKLSVFCIKELVNEGVLLCHAATGEMLLLTEQEYKEISSGKTLTSDWARKMAEHMYLVDMEKDEYEIVDRERRTVLEEKKENEAITSYTILPTSRCNARCFYCYEKDIPQKNMSTQTALDTADFIAENCHGEKVQISWFGGEPTLSHPIINLICKRLDDRGIEYRSSMISNGLLLDEKMIQSAKKNWRLKSIQITIDGTEKIYNKTKNYKGYISNPFATVLSNINCMLENDIHVSIRINLGLHNFEDVSNLIDYLKDFFHKKKLLSVYVHEIDNVYNECQHEDLIKRTYELNQRLIEMGMHTPRGLPSLRLHSCMADSDDSLLINPDGQLGKCEHYAFEKQIGSIYSLERNQAVIDEWKERAVYEACRSCPLYASCFQLKWCNGGLVCSESTVKGKIASIQKNMRILYEQWKKKCYKIRTELTFILDVQIKIREEDKEIIVDFYRDKDEIESMILNSTGRDILLFLQEKHDFIEIINMLQENYTIDSYPIEQSVEDYLLQLLRYGVLFVQKKE